MSTNDQNYYWNDFEESEDEPFFEEDANPASEDYWDKYIHDDEYDRSDFDDGGTGHGDLSYSDADPGL